MDKLPLDAEIIEVVDENGTTVEYLIRVDKGEVSWVFQTDLDPAGINAKYGVKLDPVTIKVNEFDLAKEFIETDTLIDAGNLDGANERYDEFFDNLDSVKRDEKWWQNQDFTDRYLYWIEANTDKDGKFNRENFLTSLQNDSTLDDLLGKDGYGRDILRSEFNAAQSRRLDNAAWQLNLETNIEGFMSTALTMGVSDDDLKHDTHLINSIKLIASNLSSGKYGDPVSEGAQARAIKQLTKLVDPSSNWEQDPDIAAASKGISMTPITTKQDEIRSAMNEWLPEDLWIDIDIPAEAGKLRNNPNYITQFTEMIKEKKYAEYGMYDKDIKWSTIRDNKKSAIKNVWGMDVKGNDPILKEVIKMNDVTKELEFLRGRGMELGIEKVKNDFAIAQAGAYGEGIVRTESFIER